MHFARRSQGLKGNTVGEERLKHKTKPIQCYTGRTLFLYQMSSLGVIDVLMLTGVTVLLLSPLRQLSSMFDKNWDVPLEVRSIGGQLHGGVLTLSQHECDEAP